jgi:hypothetical protein
MTAPHRRMGFSPTAPNHGEPEVSRRGAARAHARRHRARVRPGRRGAGSLLEDRSRYPRYPWRDLAGLAGPMCPGELILIAARTGGGKSLFLQNLFDP